MVRRAGEVCVRVWVRAMRSRLEGIVTKSAGRSLHQERMQQLRISKRFAMGLNKTKSGLKSQLLQPSPKSQHDNCHAPRWTPLEI